MELKENVIEWISGDTYAMCTFSQKKYINRVRRMAENHAQCVEILAENEDGSVLVRIPLSAVHLTIYGKRASSFGSVSNDEEEDEDD